MDKIRTLIVDDNHLFKESLLSLLSRHGEINVVGSVTESQECMDFIEHTPVDLIIKHKYPI